MDENEKIALIDEFLKKLDKEGFGTIPKVLNH